MSALFTTERLCVRKFLPTDSDDLAEILTDKDVTYFEPYETFTKEACVKEAENFSKSDEFFAVVLGEKVIGKLYFSARGNGSFELGYTFNGNYQGKGYAYESARGFLEYAFNSLGARRIFAEINARNDKSIKLVERLKMRKEATFRELLPRKENAEIFDDFLLYAMLKSEFQS